MSETEISAEKDNLTLSEVSEVNKSEDDTDTADSHPENVDVEVQEYDSSTDEEEEVDGGDNTIWATNQDQQQISDVKVLIF